MQKQPVAFVVLFLYLFNACNASSEEKMEQPARRNEAPEYSTYRILT